MRMHALEHGNPAVGAAKDLGELHRGDHERERAAELEVARVRLRRSSRRARVREHGQQLGVRVERHHLVSPRREVGGHAAGAGPEVEDRAVRGAGRPEGDRGLPRRA